MDNLNNKSSNSNPDTNEVLMSNENQIIELFQAFLSNGGSPKVTSFKKHLDQLISENVKPLCVRSGKTPDGNDWRSQLKSQFSGRGAKWVQVSIDNILPTLDKFDTEDFETESYREFIETAGFAWIRFSGPRINENIQSAAFEVRTNGSKIDHPKQLHYIPVDQLDEIIKPLNGTPHSLKLESAAPEANQEESDEVVLEQEVAEEIEESVEVIAEDQEIEYTDEDLNEDFAELYEEEDVFAAQA